MTKQTIEIDVPDGYELQYLGRNIFNSHMFAEVKKPPRRRIFECVSEEPMQAQPGQWYENERGALVKIAKGCLPTEDRYKIFKEVTENQGE